MRLLPASLNKRSSQGRGKKYDTVACKRNRRRILVAITQYKPFAPLHPRPPTNTLWSGGGLRVYSITGGAHSLSSPLSPSRSLSNSLPLAIWSMIPSGTGSAGAHWCALAAPPSMKSGISSTATCQCLWFEI